MDPADTSLKGGQSNRARWPWWTLFAMAGVAVVVVAAVFVVGGPSGLFNRVPTYASLRTQPDPTIVGTVADSTMGVATPEGKKDCVEVVAAGGGTPVQLFCVNWGKEKGMAPDLLWLADGRLDVTSVDSNHWRKLVDVATGAVTDMAWSTPSSDTSELGPRGQVLEWRVSLGTLKLTMSAGKTKKTLLSIAVSREYSLSGPARSPSGEWFTVVDSASHILVVTTGETPRVRFLIDGESPAVTGRTFARLALSS